jgi:hypothetical protein
MAFTATGEYREVGLTDDDKWWLSWKMDLASFSVGVVFAVVLNTVYHVIMPTENMQFTFGSCLMMAGVGAEYLGIALRNGNFKQFFLEFNMMLAFPALIICGMAFDVKLVALAWLLHPIYDILHHPSYLLGLSEAIGAAKTNPKIGAQFCMWCAGIDFMQALYIYLHFAPEGMQFGLLPDDPGAVVTV